MPPGQIQRGEDGLTQEMQVTRSIWEMKEPRFKEEADGGRRNEEGNGKKQGFWDRQDRCASRKPRGKRYFVWPSKKRDPSGGGPEVHMLGESKPKSFAIRTKRNIWGSI